MISPILSVRIHPDIVARLDDYCAKNYSNRASALSAAINLLTGHAAPAVQPLINPVNQAPKPTTSTHKRPGRPSAVDIQRKEMQDTLSRITAATALSAHMRMRPRYWRPRFLRLDPDLQTRRPSPASWPTDRPMPEFLQFAAVHCGVNGLQYAYVPTRFVYATYPDNPGEPVFDGGDDQRFYPDRDLLTRITSSTTGELGSISEHKFWSDLYYSCRNRDDRTPDPDLGYVMCSQDYILDALSDDLGLLHDHGVTEARAHILCTTDWDGKVMTDAAYAPFAGRQED